MLLILSCFPISVFLKENHFGKDQTDFLAQKIDFTNLNFAIFKSSVQNLGEEYESFK